MKIALTGNPNSGKTTMYNALTGRNEKVGNWAGVTVEAKEHTIKKQFYKGDDLIVVDLPGAYSMSPFTSEESITRDYVTENNPDVIINIVDSTNLNRSLFFTTQLLELGIPVVVALNKADINEKKHTVIDIQNLSELLNCPVIETVSTSKKGLKDLIKIAVSLIGKGQNAPYSDGEIDLSNKEIVLESDKKRFNFVNEIVEKVEVRETLTNKKNFQDKIDAILTNKWLGIPIFAVVMFLVFWISQVGPGVWIAEGIDLGDGKFIPGLTTLLGMFQEWIASMLGDGFWSRVLTEGVIGGVSAVVSFLPLVMVMYFLIALLEDCGYMSRVSIVLDPIFKKVGLSGKSVIPFVIGTGCSVPGVMACRTIRDERERRSTAMLAPFMPCGAKLPVIALFAGAFFGKSPWMGPIMYFVGIVIIFLSALLVNAITGVKRKKSYFIMEMPEYKAPSLKRALLSMCERGWSYIVKAGTIILICNFAIFVLQSVDWNFKLVEEGMEQTSILTTLATPFAYVLAPVVGVVAWQLAAAAVTGFIAKENVVGTLAVCYGFQHMISDELSLVGSGSEVANIMGISSLAAISYLMFNLFIPPCFAAIGAMNSEMKSKKWFWGGIGLQFAVGFTVSFLVFFFGSLFTNSSLGAVWMPIVGWAIVLVCVTVITYLIIRKKKEVRVVKLENGKLV